MSQFHRDAASGDIHRIHQWLYVDEASRLAATGFVDSDVGKISLQSDAKTYWILTNYSPITWQLIGDGKNADVTAAKSEIDTHIAAASAAHAASAISYDHTVSNLSATNVKAAIDELASGGGGGGGGSLQWSEPLDSAMPSDPFDGTYLFSVGQKLETKYRVPQGYKAGNPIKMNLLVQSPDSSGTALLQTVVTLIRKGVDTKDSTANQHTSTNTELFLGPGTANIPQQVICDLSDGDGLVNAVPVSPGDRLLVTLQRAADTAASPLEVDPYEAEVTLT